MREPILDLELTGNQKAILVVECPECGDKSRFQLAEVPPGTSTLCNCGGVLNITDANLKSIHQKLANINK
jgi:RNase P subunit RPR2